MNLTKRSLFLLLGFTIIFGCAKRIPVTYEQVEMTNDVKITLVSGKTIEGTVLNSEPHQLTIRNNEQGTQVILKSSIRSIQRKPPVVDDFGNGISEEEIQSVKTNKNAIIYGIGGGALSLATSFFGGSLMAHDSTSDGSVLRAATMAGGGLGTYLFIRAGQVKDRQEAIETIRAKRRSAELKKEEKTQTTDDIEKSLDEEKKKQEELRKEREALLRELGK